MIPRIETTGSDNWHTAPVMSEARRQHVHGRLLTSDAIWQPTYRALVAAVVAVWMTAALIGFAAWAQFASPAASQLTPADGTTSPASIEAAAGDTGDRL